VVHDISFAPNGFVIKCIGKFMCRKMQGKSYKKKNKLKSKKETISKGTKKKTKE
jgi:hypothetical protein